MSPVRLAPVFLVALSVVRSAAAEETDPKARPVTLDWSAPKGCPSGDEVSARTAARLPPDARVTAKGRVTSVGGHYKLSLEIESKGERVLEAPTCDALASSAAVVLAMSFEPAPPPATEKETPAAAPARDPEPPRPERPSSPPPAGHRRTFGARLHAIGDVGTLPSAGAGGGLALGFDPIARLHLEVTGNVWGAQDGTLSSDASRGATFQLVTAGARGCWVLTRPVTLAPCLGAEAMVLSAHGFGANRPSDATSIGWAPDATLMLGLPLGPHLVLRAGVGASAPTSRQAFVIASGTSPDVVDGIVHRPAAVVARGWLGPEVVF